MVPGGPWTIAGPLESHPFIFKNTTSWKTENQQNKGMHKTNTCGHKNIFYCKKTNKWRFEKVINKKRYQRSFNSKIDCICYKFIYLMINN